MSDIAWFQAVEFIEPHIVRISTPRMSGTGFLLSQNQITPVTAIATAAHVINQAHYWEEPIRLLHLKSGKTVLIHHNERAVFLDEQRDTAAILLRKDSLPLPDSPLPLSPLGTPLRVGSDIGWLGFPAIPAANLCFFGGQISAWLQAQSAYLVDGVAINGVSGGPAFTVGGQETPVHIIGVVSAYMPNRATGEVLPGLSVVRDVSQFHELVPRFHSLDEAKYEETPSTAAAEEQRTDSSRTSSSSSSHRP